MRITVEPSLQILAQFVLVECDICGHCTLDRFWPVASLYSRVVEQTVSTVKNKSLSYKSLLEEDISDKISHIIAFHALVIVGTVGRAGVKSCSWTVKLDAFISDIIFFILSQHNLIRWRTWVGVLCIF